MTPAPARRFRVVCGRPRGRGGRGGRRRHHQTPRGCRRRTRPGRAAGADRRRPSRGPVAAAESRRLETQLMMVLGAGFGFGCRAGGEPAVRGLAPGLTVVGWWPAAWWGCCSRCGWWVSGAAARPGGAGPVGHRCRRGAAVDGRGAGRDPGAGRRSGLTADWPPATRPRARRPPTGSPRSMPNCVSMRSRSPRAAAPRDRAAAAAAAALNAVRAELSEICHPPDRRRQTGPTARRSRRRNRSPELTKIVNALMNR